MTKFGEKLISWKIWKDILTGMLMLMKQNAQYFHQNAPQYFSALMHVHPKYNLSRIQKNEISLTSILFTFLIPLPPPP